MMTAKEFKARRKNYLSREAIKQEIQELAKKSVGFKATMDASKTEAKRELYKKKLTRNNIKVFELVDALDRIPSQDTDPMAEWEAEQAKLQAANEENIDEPTEV